MTKPTMELISYENPVFTTFVAWSSLLVIKMMLLSVYTAITRVKTGAFANPEDAGARSVRFNIEEVERVRRAHRNDLENILPGFLIGFIYVLINPSPLYACFLFKVAAIARILHTIVYAVIVIPQPARALAFFVHYGITIYMGLMIVLHLL